MAHSTQLDADQRRIVAHRTGPLLTLAGPGTGKTTTLVEAVADRLSGPDPLNPDQVLVLTFGRDAAGEIRQRIMARLGGGGMPSVSTFHSFCFGLVRRFGHGDVLDRPVRLMSGVEQDARIQEILLGAIEDERIEWPEELVEALGTQGLSAEVREVVAQARSLGWGPDELIAAGRSRGIQAWVAVGRFLGEYLDVLGLEGALDYTELVHQAVELTADPDVQQQLRGQFRAIFVDEYQDTDPAQVELIKRLYAPGASLIAVGDPDQAIYRFRGADVRSISTFAEDFPGAEFAVLSTTRRFPKEIGTAALAALRNVSLGGVPADVQRRHRAPEYALSAAPETLEQCVQVLTFDSAGAQAAHVADLLQRARDRADLGLDWSDMAVLVRSGVRELPALRRGLAAAGIPVQVAGEATPLVLETPVTALVDALCIVLDGPRAITDEARESLLHSPLCGLSQLDLRRVARSLRSLDDGSAEPLTSLVRLERTLLAVLEGTLSDGVREALEVSVPGRRLQRFGQLLDKARRKAATGASVGELLWELWDGTRWSQDLKTTAMRGGTSARRANRELDAVLTLFKEAERSDEQYEGAKGVRTFVHELRAQRIGVQREGSTLPENAVHLITAHRAKGLEWPLVVIAGVQAGSWPDVRPVDTVLQSHLITGESGVVTPGELLADERRLFFVACSRAKQRLVVTAVKSESADGDQPSRFLADLPVDVRHVPGRPWRSRSTQGLLAHLRRTASDPESSPAIREAAVQQLRRMRDATDDDGRPLVPLADPRNWWTGRGLTDAERPVRPSEEPIRLSASALENILDCPRRWFLEREAGGRQGQSAAMGFGSVFHEVADLVVRGELPADAAVISDYVDEVWQHVDFESEWQAIQQRRAADEAIARFLRWQEESQREPLASEHKFAIEVEIIDEMGRAHVVALSGSMDRVDLSDEGLHVVDYKTGKSPFKPDAVADHVQLALYQYVLELTDDFEGDPAGAEFVHVRQGAGGTDQPKVQAQGKVDRDALESKLLSAVSTIRGERFDAVPNNKCVFCTFKDSCPTQSSGGEILS